MGGPEHQDRAAAEYPREDRSFRLYRANRAAAGHGKRGILLGLGDNIVVASCRDVPLRQLQLLGQSPDLLRLDVISAGGYLRGHPVTRRCGVSTVPAAARWKCHASGTKRYT